MKNTCYTCEHYSDGWCIWARDLDVSLPMWLHDEEVDDEAYGCDAWDPKE